MPTRHFEYRKILETLSAHDVDYILIGGVCAVAHGAPVTTFDVDILYDMAAANVDRLMAALVDLQAHHREPGSQQLPPDRAALERGGPALFSTAHGALDALGILSGNRRYREMLAHSQRFELSDGLSVPTMCLETLIAVKRDTGRPKDLAVLPLLEAALRERLRDRGGDA
jgi:hypothetical protein